MGLIPGTHSYQLGSTDKVCRMPRLRMRTSVDHLMMKYHWWWWWWWFTLYLFWTMLWLVITEWTVWTDLREDLLLLLSDLSWVHSLLVTMVTPLAATSRSWLCLRHHCCHWQIIFTAGDCEPRHDWSELKSETEEFNILRWYREASHTQK